MTRRCPICHGIGARETRSERGIALRLCLPCDGRGRLAIDFLPPPPVEPDTTHECGRRAPHTPGAGGAFCTGGTAQ
jgi:hypothetical protein